MATDDWYTKGYEQLQNNLAEIVVDNNEPEQIGAAIYSYLTEAGFIDYDVEKDIFYDWICGDSE